MMNNTIKKVLLVIGLALIIYGIYMIIAPETSIGIGDFSIEAQDNSNAYFIVAGGLIALLIGVVAKSK